MAKGGKKRYMRPGQIASDYLQVRENQIRENRRQFEALGLHHFTCSQGEPPVVSDHEMNDTGRNRNSEEDYIPSDQDDEYSLSSSSDEAPEMPSSRRSSRIAGPDAELPSPNEVVGSTSHGLDDIRATVDPTTSGAASAGSTRTRGLSRGLICSFGRLIAGGAATTDGAAKHSNGINHGVHAEGGLRCASSSP